MPRLNQAGEATGTLIISDGEQCASSFATYLFTDPLAGAELADNLAADGQYFAIFANGHHRQLPRLTRGPFKYKTYAGDDLEKLIKYAAQPMKQAVIAPSMLALLYPLDDEVPDYPREQFLEDLCNKCKKGIRGGGGACFHRLHGRAVRLPQRPQQSRNRSRHAGAV